MRTEMSFLGWKSPRDMGRFISGTCEESHLARDNSETREESHLARDKLVDPPGTKFFPPVPSGFFYFHSSGDCLHIISILWGSSWDELIPPQSYFKALLHCVIFSATCLTMFENVALQVGEVGCYTTARSQQLAIFLALFSYQERKTRSVRMRPC